MPPPKPIPQLTQKQIERFWSHVERPGPNDCWDWQGSTNGKKNYGKVGWGGHFYLAHRVAYTIQNDDPGELLVCHTCDNPRCCNPQHLFVGTQSDNLNDMVVKGRRNPPHISRMARGNGHYNVKLTESQVRQIRQRRGSSTYALGKEFGVAPATIHDVILHRTWKHIT